MPVSFIEELVRKIHAWDNLGVHELPHNETGIGRLSRGAYLHNYFPALQKDDLLKIEQTFGLELPQDFKDFYLYTNGIALFKQILMVYGNKTNSINNYSSDYTHVLEKQNVFMEMLGKPDHCFVFGEMTVVADEHTSLCLDTMTGLIHMPMSNINWTVAKTWQSLPELLHTEFYRLVELHDQSGQRTFQFPGEAEGRESLRQMSQRFDNFRKSYTLPSSGMTDEWQRIAFASPAELIEAFENNDVFKNHIARIEQVTPNESYVITKPKLDDKQFQRWREIVSEVQQYAGREVVEPS